MFFTEGKHQEYERMMKEIPRPPKEVDQNKLSELTIQKRDCPYCLYYDKKHKSCKLNRCIAFDE